MRITLSVILLLSVSHVNAQKFIKGHYYDHTGQKYEGLIRLILAAQMGNGPDNHIMFKEAGHNTPYKITTKDAKTFVMDKDSFTIVKNFEINDFAAYSEDFVQVVSSGKINLYRHYSTGGAGVTMHGVANYLVEKDGKLQRLKKNDFKDDYTTLFAEYPEIVEKIKEKEFSFNDIEQIVALYNLWIRK